MGEGVPRESSINDKRIVAPTPAREQRTRGETVWFPAPRSMNQVRTKTHGNSQATVHEAELVPSVLGSLTDRVVTWGLGAGELSGDYVA